MSWIARTSDLSKTFRESEEGAASLWSWQPGVKHLDSKPRLHFAFANRFVLKEV